MKLYYNLALVYVLLCLEYAGDFEVLSSDGMESTVKYRARKYVYLTPRHYLAGKQCLVGSLTRAVAS
jgi:hypothetical protein